MDETPHDHEPSTAAAGHGRPARPRTILVLGGGGLKGVAHVGVLRALERLGIEVDVCVGTSLGAVVGALLAAGEDSARLGEAVRAIATDELIGRHSLQSLVVGHDRAAARRGERYRELLSEQLPVMTFGELRRPFVCSALSVSTGVTQYFGIEGGPDVPLADAVYASSCLPGFFEPIRIGGEFYVDGGLAENLPVRVAEALQPDLVLVVDLTRVDLDRPVPFRSAVPHVLYQTYEILGNVINEQTLHRFGNEPHLVLIKPDLGDAALTGGSDPSELVSRGEQEAYRRLASHPRTRYLCDPDVVKHVDRTTTAPRDYVRLDVDMDACVNCGVCAVTCATGGYAAVPFGNVVRKLHHYECTRDAACVRHCPTRAIRLG